MRPDELRSVFADAAADTPPPGLSVADTITAGRRSVRRRRLGAATGVAGVAALALAGTVVLAPWANGSGTPPGEVDAADPVTCQVPPDHVDGKPDARAVMYSRALGGELESALEGGEGGDFEYPNPRGEWSGFLFDAGLCGYVSDQYVVFDGTKIGDRAPLEFHTVVYEPADEPVRDRMSKLADCEGAVADAGGTCAFTDDGDLEVEYVTPYADGDDEPQDRKVRSVLTTVGGHIVEMGARLDGERKLWITFGELLGLARAMPVGETPDPLPEVPGPLVQATDDARITAFQQAVAAQVPGAVLTPASGDAFLFERADPDSSEGVAMAATLTLPDGETMTVTVEVWNSEYDGGGESRKGSLENWGNCHEDGASCEYHDGEEDSTGTMTRRQGDEVSYWVAVDRWTEDAISPIIGVLVAPADGAGEISLTVEQIAAIATAVPA